MFSETEIPLFPEAGIDAKKGRTSIPPASPKKYSSLEKARQRASFIRWKSIEHADKYLIEFEANFNRCGGKVVWAQNAEEACMEISNIISRHKGASVKQSGNIILKETGVHSFLGSKKNVGTNENVNTVSIGITGVNFLIADPGAVVISENNNCETLIAWQSNIHIAVAGIDQVISSMMNLETLLPVLSLYGSNKAMNTETCIITGPGKTNSIENATTVYVILVDNGRSAMMAKEKQRQALLCIQCHACKKHDTVFKLNGDYEGQTYFNNPVGTVLLPFSNNFQKYISGSFAHPADNAAMDMCPVAIDFRKLLLQNRKEATDAQVQSRSERWFYFFWKKSVMKRNFLNTKGIRTFSWFTNALFNKSEKNLRSLFAPAQKSFNEQWRELYKL